MLFIFSRNESLDRISICVSRHRAHRTQECSGTRPADQRTNRGAMMHRNVNCITKESAALRRGVNASRRRTHRSCTVKRKQNRSLQNFTLLLHGKLVVPTVIRTTHRYEDGLHYLNNWTRLKIYDENSDRSNNYPNGDFIGQGVNGDFFFKFIVPAGINSLLFEGSGGGGGGGGGASGRGANRPNGGGGAGGNGVDSVNLYEVSVNPGDSIEIAVGAGGTGGDGAFGTDQFGRRGRRGSDTVVTSSGIALFNFLGALGGNGGEFQRSGETWVGGDPSSTNVPGSPVGYFFTSGGAGGRGGRPVTSGQTSRTPIGGTGGRAGVGREGGAGGGGGGSVKGNGGDGGTYGGFPVSPSYGQGQAGQFGAGGGGGAGGGPGTSDNGGAGGRGGMGYVWVYIPR